MDRTDLWVRRAIDALDGVYKQNNTTTINHNRLEHQEKERLYKELGTSSYTLDELGSFLKECSLKHSFRLGSCTIDIICKRMSKTIERQVLRTLHRTNAIARMFDIKKQTHFVLIPLDRPRVKPALGEKVEPKHVNGGYTYIHGNIIYIYRLEEWPKVALHEMLHHAAAIQNIKWRQEYIQKLYSFFSIATEGCPISCNTVLEPTEAVVETWAIFLNIAFISYEDKKDFHKLLSDEIAWNNHQIRWIIKKQDHEKGVWKEGTHIFSYIVLRGILLKNLEEFMTMRMPYRARELCNLWINNWKKQKAMIMEEKPRWKNTDRTLRMSLYGNLDTA